MHQKKYLKWELGHSTNATEIPQKWYAATVPGAVQLDVAAAAQYAPYYFADHCHDYLWMEDQYWWYQTQFISEELSSKQNLYFVSKGIDYQFEILLNGQLIHYQEGMFSPVQLSLTDFLVEGTNLLVIKIFPIPKLYQSPQDRGQAAQSVKPAASYGWDWHPRLVPIGIWDETYLEIRPKVHISTHSLAYELSENLEMAALTLDADFSGYNHEHVEFSIFSPDGTLLHSESKTLDRLQLHFQLHLENIILWYPVGYGNPTLYRYQLSIYEEGVLITRCQKKFGFRKVALVMNEGAWDEPKQFPKSRSVPPIQLQVNHQKVFCKGSNLVNPDIFPSVLTQERYEELVEKALEAHFNILRNWGGGIVQKEAFYELCDEKGLMIWQEFPLACNNYQDTTAYLAVLTQEATAIIKRISQHPALVLWCGGNELFNNWSGMTDQSRALRLLNSLCLQLDPFTPFIATAPLMGMAHGSYVFKDPETGEEVFQLFRNAKNTAYSEFGLPSPSSYEILKKIIPAEELHTPQAGTTWETHHAFNAWLGDTWLMKDLIESYFGKTTHLRELISYGQLLQAEGLKFIFEEARRQQPYCAMVLNWCMNEPWFTAANSSILNYPCTPKPSFYSVKAACRPTLASARVPKFQWQEGETFTADIWMLNDSLSQIESDTLHIKVILEDKEITLLNWTYPQILSQQNIEGPSVRLILPKANVSQFQFVIEVERQYQFNTCYTFLYQQKETHASEKIKALNQ